MGTGLGLQAVWLYRRSLSRGGGRDKGKGNFAELGPTSSPYTSGSDRALSDSPASSLTTAFGVQHWQQQAGAIPS